MKKKLWRPFFGGNIKPACEYCGKFFYSPLKRVPKRLPALPSYSEEEFKL